MFFGDCRWYAANYKELLKFAGLKITVCEQHFDKPGIRNHIRISVGKPEDTNKLMAALHQME